MPEIIRVVIDTNHIISAILSKRGASAKLADWMIREDYFQLLIYSGVKIVHIRKLLFVLEKMEKTRRNSEKTKK
ncbi:MAG: hypothetical protein ACREAE_07890 [Nitrosopumilaceae archaeon]